MSRTYTVTGINLKSMPLGESDRLLTILTPEFGLIRAVAPGARKHQSRFAGRSALFVVNEFMIAQGRTLDKITQAETIESYPGLSQDLRKLTASQYLAELVLYQALSDQPQVELYELLNEHLRRLEQLSHPTWVTILAHLTHGIFHQLALAGIAPQVQYCCVTHNPLVPDFTDPNWQIGFSASAGGTVSLAALQRLEAEARSVIPRQLKNRVTTDAAGATYAAKLAPIPSAESQTGTVTDGASNGYQTIVHPQAPPRLNTKLNAIELALFQQLAAAKLPQKTGSRSSAQAESTRASSSPFPAELIHTSEDAAWVSVEQILRQYVQYHFGRSIRSAALMDACFSSQLS